jgi:hypothetical protein
MNGPLRRRVSLGTCVLGALAVWAGDAHAYWSSDFTITGLYVAGENNFQYRAYGVGTLAMCPNSPNWAYVNDNDSGAKGRVATILAAFYSGRPIRVFLSAQGGFCRIDEVFAS